MHKINEYEAIYILKPEENRLIGKIDARSTLGSMGVEHLSYFLSHGDILRCFTAEGFVDTYVIHKQENGYRPMVVNM